MLTAEDIRYVRESLNLTATEFAVKLGVSENAVRRWEMGNRHPRWGKLMEINKLAVENKISLGVKAG